MLRGLYDFKPRNEKTLGFEMNERLLYIEAHPRDKNWLRVVNIYGLIGLVPINYIDIDREITCDAVMGFLEEAVRSTRRERSPNYEILLAVQANIKSSIHTIGIGSRLEELEREVMELRSKSISEMRAGDESRRIGTASVATASKGKHAQTSQSSVVAHTSRSNKEKGSKGSGKPNKSEGARAKAAVSMKHTQSQTSKSSCSKCSNCAGTEENTSHGTAFVSDNVETSAGADPFIDNLRIVQKNISQSQVDRTVSEVGISKNPLTVDMDYRDLVVPPPPAMSSTDITLPTATKCALDYSAAKSMLEIHLNKMKGQPQSFRTSMDNEKVQEKHLGATNVPARVSANEPVYAKPIHASKMHAPGVPLGASLTVVGEFYSEENGQDTKIAKLACDGAAGDYAAPPIVGLSTVGRRASLPNVRRRSQELSAFLRQRTGDEATPEFDGLPSITVALTRKLTGEIIDAVRTSTGMSHQLSQVALQTVLQHLQDNIQGGSWEKQLALMLETVEAPRAIAQCPMLMASSADAVNLRAIFKNLTECKDDQQQRSWALHEDEGMIVGYLNDMNIILNNADPSISQGVMAEDQYTTINGLVLYYQMETRWSIRSLLVDNFALMSTIDDQASSILLDSILPMELAREILESEKTPERMCMAAALLVVLLSTGESMPITHFEYIGVKFLNFVLDIVEEPPNDDEKIADDFMNVVFALNLQFEANDDNLIIKTLSERHHAKEFTQKIIYYLNREIDPLAFVEREGVDKPMMHSVFKLVTDLFYCPKTADLFYTNDIKVLIDIMVRCLTDLCPGDKRRVAYLHLIRVVIRNTNYSEHMHRSQDLRQCFTTILLEEDTESVSDQELVREICNEFPQYFGKK